MPSTAPIGGGDEVVGRPLVEERLHEVAPLGADGPGHAHLRPPLGGQHHEDEEDQQDAGRHREAAERGEQLDEDVAGRVGGVEAVALGRLGVEPERGDGLVEGRLDGVGGLDSGGLAAGVRHQHVVGLAGAAEEVLRAGGATGARRGRRWSCRGSAATPATAHLGDVVAGEHDDGAATAGAAARRRRPR